MQTTSERRTRKAPRVPRATENPIRELNAAGVRVVELAKAWGVTPDAVRKLRRFEFSPRYPLAIRMAATFGWSGGGEVIEYFSKKVAA